MMVEGMRQGYIRVWSLQILLLTIESIVVYVDFPLVDPVHGQYMISDALLLRHVLPTGCEY